jgi:chromate transporter
VSIAHGGFREHWREVIGTFLKIGALSYGGAASMGVMQTEVQEKRAWIPKEQFIEGLALVNTLPGPGGIQLGIFLGYTRAGWWGGVLAGLCFILRAFCIMLSLTLIYHHYGALPQIRHLFYGLSPVVVGMFAMSLYRLGRSAVRDGTQVLLAVASAMAVGLTPLGIVPTLLLAGAAGVALYGSRAWGIVSALVIMVLYGAHHWGSEWLIIPALTGTGVARAVSSLSPGLWDIGFFFLKVGAFTFGGGLTILAFMQDQVVNRLHWLTIALADAAAIPRWSCPRSINPGAYAHAGRVRGICPRVHRGRRASCGRGLQAIFYSDALGAPPAGAHETHGLDESRAAGN